MPKVQLNGGNLSVNGVVINDPARDPDVNPVLWEIRRERRMESVSYTHLDVYKRQGSNSCFYDGKSVVKNVRAGGYILGDEGSGAVLGKMFLSDVLKGDVYKRQLHTSPHKVIDMQL